MCVVYLYLYDCILSLFSLYDLGDIGMLQIGSIPLIPFWKTGELYDGSQGIRNMGASKCEGSVQDCTLGIWSGGL